MAKPAWDTLIRNALVFDGTAPSLEKWMWPSQAGVSPLAAAIFPLEKLPTSSKGKASG